MLQIQNIDTAGPDTIPLVKFETGQMTPSRLWLTQFYGTGLGTSERTFLTEEILYLDDGSDQRLDYFSSAAGAPGSPKSYQAPTVYMMGSTYCNSESDPQPLYYYHVCPGLPDDVQVTLFNIFGEAIPEIYWKLVPQTSTNNARIYVRESGWYRIAYTGEDFYEEETAALIPVRPPWTQGGTPYGADWIEVATITENVTVGGTARNDEVLSLKVPAGTKSEAFRVFGSNENEIYKLEINHTSDKLILYRGTAETVDLEIELGNDPTIGDIQQQINQLEQWSCEIYVPKRTVAQFHNSTYLLAQAKTALDSNTGILVECRCVFVKSFVRQQFELSVPEYINTLNWRPVIAPGSFVSFESLRDKDKALIEATTGSISGTVRAKWAFDAHIADRRTLLDQQGQIIGTTDPVDSFIGANGSIGVDTVSTNYEILIPVDGTGRRFRTSRRYLSPNPISEIWVGETRYETVSDVIASVDTITGEIITKFTITEQIRVKYRSFDNTIVYNGYVDVVSGQWKQLEMNPLLTDEKNRYKSLIIVLVPTEITVFTTNVDTFALHNSSPIRFMYTDNPFEEWQKLDDHPLTRMPVGVGAYITLPYRVLATILWQPDFAPGSVPSPDVRAQGGNLLPLTSPQRTRYNDPNVRGYELLTGRKGYQINQSLVIYLPSTLLNTLSLAQVRQEIQRYLPASTYYNIEWYDERPEV